MPFVAGNDIDSFCPRCNRDTNHTVIEAHSGLVQLVRCSACKDTHAYKRPHTFKPPPKPARKPSTRRRSTVKKKPVELGPPSEWQDTIMGKDPENSQPYSIRQTFELHDIIDHSKFGMGVVTEVEPDGKITIAFRDGKKKLIHGRS